MKFMESALNEAIKASDINEIPVGCVITYNDEIIASSHNTTIKDNDCTCHAEINALKQAMKKKGERILDDCDMYVTLEPCPMCAGAIINAKIKRLYIGAPEPKSGCFGSVTDFNRLPFNHKTEVYHGICEDKCRNVIQDFFIKIRK